MIFFGTRSFTPGSSLTLRRSSASPPIRSLQEAISVDPRVTDLYPMKGAAEWMVSPALLMGERDRWRPIKGGDKTIATHPSMLIQGRLIKAMLRIHIIWLFLMASVALKCKKNPRLVKLLLWTVSERSNYAKLTTICASSVDCVAWGDIEICAVKIFFSHQDPVNSLVRPL